MLQGPLSGALRAGSRFCTATAGVSGGSKAGPRTVGARRLAAGGTLMQALPTHAQGMRRLREVHPLPTHNAVLAHLARLLVLLAVLLPPSVGVGALCVVQHALLLEQLLGRLRRLLRLLLLLALQQRRCTGMWAEACEGCRATRSPSRDPLPAAPRAAPAPASAHHAPRARAASWLQVCLQGGCRQEAGAEGSLSAARAASGKPGGGNRWRRQAHSGWPVRVGGELGGPGARPSSGQERQAEPRASLATRIVQPCAPTHLCDPQPSEGLYRREP